MCKLQAGEAARPDSCCDGCSSLSLRTEACLYEQKACNERVGLGVDHGAKLGSCHLAHCPNLPAPGCLLVSDRK